MSKTFRPREHAAATVAFAVAGLVLTTTRLMWLAVLVGPALFLGWAIADQIRREIARREAEREAAEVREEEETEHAAQGRR
jgi:hypothetical protein